MPIIISTDNAKIKSITIITQYRIALGKDYLDLCTKYAHTMLNI